MRLTLLTLLLLSSTACLVRKPVIALYCVDKSPNGKCLTWATSQTATGDLPFPGPKIGMGK